MSRSVTRSICDTSKRWRTSCRMASIRFPRSRRLDSSEEQLHLREIAVRDRPGGVSRESARADRRRHRRLREASLPSRRSSAARRVDRRRERERADTHRAGCLSNQRHRSTTSSKASSTIRRSRKPTSTRRMTGCRRSLAGARAIRVFPATRSVASATDLRPLLPGQAVIEQPAKATQFRRVEVPIAHELREQLLGRAGEDLVQHARESTLAGDILCDRRAIAMRFSFGDVRDEALSSSVRRIVSTVVYARSSSIASRTSLTVPVPRCQSTAITSSSRSVKEMSIAVVKGLSLLHF